MNIFFQDNKNGSTREWECIELREDNGRLDYGRFFMAPLLEGQADLIGSVIKKALLVELEGTSITCAKFLDIPSQYATIPGVEESVFEIVMNLKLIVLKSMSDNVPRICTGRVRAKGPGLVTAQQIQINSDHIEVVGKNQRIAMLTQPAYLSIELQIETQRPLTRKISYTPEEGSYPIQASFSPIRHLDYHINRYGEGKEVLFFEIWTNGSFTPVEALSIASKKAINLLGAPLRMHKEKGKKLKNEDILKPLILEDKWERLRNNKRQLAMEWIDIERFTFSTRVSNCLKKAKIYLLFHLLNKSYKDLMQIEDLGIEGITEIIFIVQKHLEK